MEMRRQVEQAIHYNNRQLEDKLDAKYLQHLKQIVDFIFGAELPLQAHPADHLIISDYYNLYYLL
jgi:hypothetical protein